ncbi:hypothetical protein BB559_005711 [Furculomyces boomerangus]|uniref:Arginase n=2 Tax=Harpellales TaxID=61421 RepID=A0A2T9Y732_9FUNG|nr:hypothetical protein BB559_005744 [Furculomyces boomerangus]PVU88142.1 hypothetical protein BB559_005711 [Furculomyces boomerangus]PWA02063.1 hypothetical protein BB558_001800 [Smittium angustum]
MYSAVSDNKFVKSNTIAYIPASFHGGQGKSGVDFASKELVKKGICSQLEGIGYSVRQHEDTDCNEFKPAEDPQIFNAKNPIWVSEFNKHLSEQVATECRAGNRTVVVGGDHSVAIGSINGTTSVYGDDMCLVWIDAHPDIHKLDTTESGNIHGCPVSLSLGIEKNSTFGWVVPRIKKERLVYIGLRDVDPKEAMIIRENKIKAFSMTDVDRYGIGKVVEMALDHVNPNRDLPIHLSFDVDAMDPTVTPATGTPVRGGLTFREGHYVCEAIAETNCLVSMDLVEVNPFLGNEAERDQTVTVGCSLIRSAFGETLL